MFIHDLSPIKPVAARTPSGRRLRPRIDLLGRGSAAVVALCFHASLAQPLHHTHLAVMSDSLLDVKGMNCPLPVLKANRTLRGLTAGQRLRVLATDRASVGDFQAFCRETGHALLAWSEEGGVFSFVIRRRADDPVQKGS